MYMNQDGMELEHDSFSMTEGENVDCIICFNFLCDLDMIYFQVH